MPLFLSLYPIQAKVPDEYNGKISPSSLERGAALSLESGNTRTSLRLTVLGSPKNKEAEVYSLDRPGSQHANPPTLPETVISKILYGVQSIRHSALGTTSPRTVLSLLLSNGLLLDDQRPGPSLLLSVADDHSCPKHMAIDY